MGRKKSRKLTDIQKRLIVFIPKYTEEHGYPPTFREIEKQVGFSSPSMVHYNIERLEELGWVTRDPNIPRSIRVIKRLPEQNHEKAVTIQRTAQELLSIPVIGRIVASQPVPVPASDFSYFDAEFTVEVAPNMLPIRNPNLDQIYALQVKGNSMIDDLVNDGDIVILHSGQEVRNGDMVAVWLGDEGETTLKKFYREEKPERIRLQPANINMDPIYIYPSQSIEIQGKVLQIITPMQ